jgi:hypothetical protein
MTTKVMVLINGNCEVHVHTERRDESGHFVRDDTPVIIKSAGREWAELYLPDNTQIVLSEHWPKAPETA